MVAIKALNDSKICVISMYIRFAMYFFIVSIGQKTIQCLICFVRKIMEQIQYICIFEFICINLLQ